MPIPLNTRVKILSGGYSGDFATVTQFYTRTDGIEVAEVKTDSGVQLFLGPRHVEIVPPRLIEHVSGVMVIRPLAVVAGVVD